MYADGELGREEERALMAFVEQHPELKKELSLYEMTRLTPDTEVTFADKKSLIKPEPAKRIIALTPWKRYSIAAGVAALLFVGILKYLPGSTQQFAVANKDTTTHTTAVATDNTPANAASKTPEKPADTTNSNTAIQVAAHIPGKPAVRQVKNKERIQREAPVQVAAIAHSEAPISRLATAQAAPTAVSNEVAATKEMREIPAMPVALNEERKKTTLWDRLPMDDLKKEKLEEVAGAVSQAYTEVNTAKQEIDATTISVKVKKRKLIISF